MIKLQIGENTICLNKAEQDFLFQLIDEKYDYIQNIPTFNAIRNWMHEEGCRRTFEPVEKVQDPWDKTVIEDPWGYVKLEDVQKQWENYKSQEKELEEYFARKQPQDNVRFMNLRDVLLKLLSNNEDGYYVAS